MYQIFSSFPSVMSFIRHLFSLLLSVFHTSSLFQLSFCVSSPVLPLSVFLSAGHTHKHWSDYFWQVGCESAMINMLPWLFILSNGSVKLQCVDKYRRWRNIVARRRDTMKASSWSLWATAAWELLLYSGTDPRPAAYYSSLCMSKPMEMCDIKK